MQALLSLTSIAAFFMAATAGMATAQDVFRGQLKMDRFILVSAYAMLIGFAIGGIGFFAPVSPVRASGAWVWA